MPIIQVNIWRVHGKIQMCSLAWILNWGSCPCFPDFVSQLWRKYFSKAARQTPNRKPGSSVWHYSGVCTWYFHTHSLSLSISGFALFISFIINLFVICVFGAVSGNVVHVVQTIEYTTVEPPLTNCRASASSGLKFQHLCLVTPPFERLIKATLFHVHCGR